MPGGFVRIADNADARAVSLQRGGKTADAWVLSEGPVAEYTLLPTPELFRIGDGDYHAVLIPSAPVPVGASGELYAVDFVAVNSNTGKTPLGDFYPRVNAASGPGGDYALELAQALKSQDVVFTLIKDGDHRLSRPQDIARLVGAVDGINHEHQVRFLRGSMPGEANGIWIEALSGDFRALELEYRQKVGVEVSRRTGSPSEVTATILTGGSSSAGPERRSPKPEVPGSNPGCPASF